MIQSSALLTPAALAQVSLKGAVELQATLSGMEPRRIRLVQG